MRRASAILLRHGEYRQPDGVPSALLPHPLTESGFEQARGAASELVAACEERGLVLDTCIESSRLLRAWQTATTIARELQEIRGQEFEIRQWPELSERSVGAMANLTVEEIEGVLAEDPRFEVPPDGWKSSADYRLPYAGAESLREAGTRVAAIVSRSTDEVPDSSRVRLFVGHGAAFRWAAVALGALDEEEVPGLSMFHCGWVLLTPEVSGWRKTGGAWKVRARGEAVRD